MTTGTKSTTERNTVDHPSIPLSEGDSHPWTMPPVNPKCSEKDSCNAMRCGSVGAGTGVLVPHLRSHPQQLQDHTEALTTAFLPPDMPSHMVLTTKGAPKDTAHLTPSLEHREGTVRGSAMTLKLYARMYTHMCAFHLNLFDFFVATCGMWDLSSQTRD